MQPEQWYRWYLAIACNNETASDWEIEGFIYRQSQQMLPDDWERRSTVEKIEFSLTKGIWFDVFEWSANLACGSDDSSWQLLLGSPDIQLEDVAEENLICPEK